MTYQGERARPMPSENGRFFEVTKVRIGADGHVSDVLWSELDAGSGRDVGARTLATAADVVEALHDGAQVGAAFSSSNGRLPDRAFVVVAHQDGRECIAFADPASPGRELSDIGGSMSTSTIASEAGLRSPRQLRVACSPEMAG